MDSFLSNVKVSEGSLDTETDVEGPTDPIICGRLKNSDSLCELDSLLSHLPVSQRSEQIELIRKFPMFFGDTPTHTNLIEHDIDVGDSPPIKHRFYRCASDKRKALESEVKYMLDNNIAVPSLSSWASPGLLVGKSDGSPRFCTDYRKVNKVTKADSYHLPRTEDCIDLVGSVKFVSNLTY